MTPIDVSYRLDNVKIEGRSRIRQSQSLPQPIFSIQLKNDPKSAIFIWKCYICTLREVSNQVCCIRHGVIFHEKPLLCSWRGVLLIDSHNSIIWRHVPRYGSRTRVFSLERLSNFMTRNVFQRCFIVSS
jgi:hypothetical protein